MFRAPTQTPHFSTLLDDLPTRCRRQISRFLGISPATLAKWARTGNAPRLAHLALFWETRWGLSVIDTTAENERRVHRGLIDALQRENAALRAQLERLVALGATGAANDPLWGVDCERAGRPGAMIRPAPGLGEALPGVPGQLEQPQPFPPLLWR